MKIAFVLPFVNQTGGVLSTMELARRLRQRGHEVAVYYPFFPYKFADRWHTYAGLRRWMGDLALNVKRVLGLKAIPFGVTVTAVPWVSGRFMLDGDAVVATGWPTAYSVARLPASKGRRFYYIRGHEVWSGEPSKVEETYRLPLHKVTVSSWLRDLVMSRTGDGSPVDLVVNGVDTEVFYPDPSSNGGCRVLAQYSHLSLKGMDDLFQSWEIVQGEVPRATLAMFGLRKGSDVPGWVEFHTDPTPEELRRLYSSSDVFVSPSRAEGAARPPMGAMACRCAVVMTNAGAVSDYAIAGQTCLVVEPRDVRGLARGIVALLSSDTYRARVAEAGYRYIQGFTWDRTVDQFERVLQRCDSRCQFGPP